MKRLPLLLIVLLAVFLPSESEEQYPNTQAGNSCVNIAVAGGTSDALTIPTLSCVPTSALLVLTTPFANATTTPTISQNGAAPQTILASNGSALTANSLGAGGRSLLTYNGLNWFLLTFQTTSGGGITLGTTSIPQGGTAPTVSGLNLTNSTTTTPAVGDNSTALADTAFLTSYLPHRSNNAALSALASTAYGALIRDGFKIAGDSPPLLFVSSGAACSLNGGLGDGGTQVPTSDGKCWTASTTNPLQFGATFAAYSYYTVTTSSSSSSVTLGGANVPSSCANVCYLIMWATGPNERRYVGKITGGSGSAVNVSPNPTLNFGPAPTQTYIGLDSGPAINAAFAAAKTVGSNSVIPAGLYISAAPLQWNVPNYNDTNIPQPMPSGPGATIIAASNMSTSSPVAGALLTIGGYASGTDFSQNIRNSKMDSGGLTLDCSFLCSDALILPFGQEVRVQNFQTKNTLRSGIHVGSTGAPSTMGSAFLAQNTIDRDIDYVAITNVSQTNPPVVTTAYDHGVGTGRVVALIGVNNVPGSCTGTGPIEFQATATGARTLTLNGINGSGWAAFSTSVCTTPRLALTPPSTPTFHLVTAVTAAASAQITLGTTDLKIANGQTWCVYGLGGTGFSLPNGNTPPTNVPDGCYAISGVSGGNVFTVPVASTGFTYTGGGFAFQLFPAGGVVADMGIFEDNAADVQAIDNSIVGTQWPIYAGSNAGFNGKYTNNHSSDGAEQGWIIAAHYLGGFNSLTGEQCDSPTVFCAEFFSGANSASGTSLNMSGFAFLYDAQTYLFRLDSGASATGSLIVNGGSGLGNSGSVRVSTLSNNLTAGNPPYFGAIPNYQQHGFSNGGNFLYYMPDSAQGKTVFSNTPANPTGTATTASLVAMGLGADTAGGGAHPCLIVPEYSGIVNLSVTGTMFNNTASDGGFLEAVVGSGAPPANGGSVAGSLPVNVAFGITTETVGSAQWPFTASGTLGTRLNLNQTYWADIGAKAFTGGTFSIANLTCSGNEQ